MNETKTHQPEFINTKAIIFGMETHGQILN
jgi:hypothetical protein